MEKQKKFDINDFHRANIFEEEGRWISHNEKVDINYSSILTKLIQEAGRLCDYFASDLFISWESVKRWINELYIGEPKSETFVFGFRKSGVDHKEWVENKYQNPTVYGTPKEIYREIYVLKMDFDGGSLKMKLGKGEYK